MQVVAASVQIQTRGLLFDMDGVLISSIGSVERCWKRWAKLYEVPDADNFQVPHGVRAKDVIRMLKPEFSEAEVAEGTRVIEDLEIDDTGDLTVLGVRGICCRRCPPTDGRLSPRLRTA